MAYEHDDKEEKITLVSEKSDNNDVILDPKAAKKAAKAKKKAVKAEEEKNKTKTQALLEYLKVIAIGALIAFLLCRFVIINAVVPTGSMIPTIQKQDRLIGFRVIYYFSDPERGDVVIFKCPDTRNDNENYNKLYVKRVIGLPGETITIKAGQVIITTTEGETIYLDESEYLNEAPAADAPVNNTSYTLGDDEYFMMGDNRNHSDDSRYWGNVTRDRVLAKAVFKYFRGFSTFKNPVY